MQPAILVCLMLILFFQLATVGAIGQLKDVMKEYIAMQKEIFGGK